MAAGEIFPIFFLALRNIIQSLCTGHCLHLQHMLKVTDSGSTFGRLLKKIGKAARNKERNVRSVRSFDKCDSISQVRRVLLHLRLHYKMNVKYQTTWHSVEIWGITLALTKITWNQLFTDGHESCYRLTSWILFLVSKRFFYETI